MPVPAGVKIVTVIPQSSVNWVVIARTKLQVKFLAVLPSLYVLLQKVLQLKDFPM
jgi:hypothetical protein